MRVRAIVRSVVRETYYIDAPDDIFRQPLRDQDTIALAWSNDHPADETDVIDEYVVEVTEW